MAWEVVCVGNLMVVTEHAHELLQFCILGKIHLATSAVLTRLRELHRHKLVIVWLLVPHWLIRHSNFPYCDFSIPTVAAYSL